MENPPENIKHTWSRRRDRLTAQRIDVSLVFLEMLGAADAADYLAQCKIPAGVSDRVMIEGSVRQRDEGCWSDND